MYRFTSTWNKLIWFDLIWFDLIWFDLLGTKSNIPHILQFLLTKLREISLTSNLLGTTFGDLVLALVHSCWPYNSSHNMVSSTSKSYAWLIATSIFGIGWTGWIATPMILIMLLLDVGNEVVLKLVYALLLVLHQESHET